MDRRLFLTHGAAGAATLLGGCATNASNEKSPIAPNEMAATPAAPPISKEELELLEILAEEADPYSQQVLSKGYVETNPLTWFNGGTETQRNWYRAQHFVEAAPDWAPTDRSIDLAHLTAFDPANSEDFVLNAATLEFLAERNFFSLSDSMPKTLIGLRGCALPSGDTTGWAKSHALKLVLPNHVDFNCVMGVWDRNSGDIRLFAASTVPHATSMWQQVHRLRGANILPCGLYYYNVGPHAASSKRSKQVGSFRLHGAYFENVDGSSTAPDRVVVLRTIDDMTFSPISEDEIWHRTRPWDNIHSAIYAPDTPNGKRNGSQKFSSAGCQILKGDYVLDAQRRFTTTPNGPWAEFRKAAGLAHPPQLKPGSSTETKNDGKGFQYMLLTGQEAALAASNNATFKENYRCVRFGSSGDAVRSVQRELGLSGDGKFGPGSAIALLREQIRKDGVMETGVAVI